MGKSGYLMAVICTLTAIACISFSIYSVYDYFHSTDAAGFWGITIALVLINIADKRRKLIYHSAELSSVRMTTTETKIHSE